MLLLLAGVAHGAVTARSYSAPKSPDSRRFPPKVVERLASPVVIQPWIVDSNTGLSFFPTVEPSYRPLTVRGTRQRSPATRSRPASGTSSLPARSHST